MNDHPDDPPRYSPDHPHPLFGMRNELVWEGKYDEYGNRRPIRLPADPPRLQPVEMIDGPGQFEQAQTAQPDDMAGARQERDAQFRNMLIWADNKLALAALLERFSGGVDLIYIDPPFDAGANFSTQIHLGEGALSIRKQSSTLETVAYKDIWGKGADSYLHMMYERLSLMYRLLSDTGSLFVHCDWRVSSMLRVVLDEIFGKGAAAGDEPGFRNEIIYCYSGGGIPRREMPRKHDTILWYTRSTDWTFHPIYRPYSEGTVQRGRTAVKGPAAGLRQQGTPINDWWPDVKKITSPTDPEKLYYDTQKSEELLSRIITMASNEGDLVLDCFCGSGTTLAVAEKLGRRWIGVDLGRYAIHTTRKRLIEVQRQLHTESQPYRSFDLYTLGHDERRWWQLERLNGCDDEYRGRVMRFYNTVPLQAAPHPLLHGTRGKALVHVARIDGMFTFGQLRQAAEATQAAGASTLHCLAWEFEIGLAHAKQALEADLGLAIQLTYIPREIMEPNRGAARFFAAGYLEARAVAHGDAIDVELLRFAPALPEAPERNMTGLHERAIAAPFDFIDFWAVDFTWHEGKPFEHHWQGFRTRKQRSLKTRTDRGWMYTKSGRQQIGVKAVDVFGVETIAVVEVEI
jgi:adenine-specific DNA-methyltransferase